MWEFFGQASPGFINSVMIMTGQNFSGAVYDNNIGAGLPSLPVNGQIATSSVVVGPGGTVDIPVNASGTIRSIDGAIWWPEVPGTHSDIDLRLVDPNGNVVASSTSAGSIFEKARATSGLIPGTWKIRINAYSASANQVVYWAWFQQT